MEDSALNAVAYRSGDSFAQEARERHEQRAQSEERQEQVAEGPADDPGDTMVRERPSGHQVHEFGRIRVGGRLLPQTRHRLSLFYPCLRDSLRPLQLGHLQHDALRL